MPQSAMAEGECAGARSIPIDDATRALAGEALACLVNRERTSRGIPALRTSSLLTSAATRHSGDMVARGFFSHTGSSGSSTRLRIARTGYLRRSRTAVVGETLAWASGPFATPAEILGSFLESPEHRRTMLDRRFRDVGIGLVLGAPEPDVGAAMTATLDFGRR
jgi:uncharacterized protein YkwD